MSNHKSRADKSKSKTTAQVKTSTKASVEADALHQKNELAALEKQTKELKAAYDQSLLKIQRAEALKREEERKRLEELRDIKNVMVHVGKKVKGIVPKPITISGYHRTNDEMTPELISVEGFNHENSNSGALYGRGWYMNRDVFSCNSSRSVSQYGKVVIKVEVDLNKYLILDKKEAKKVYGSPLGMLEQFIVNGFGIPMEHIWETATNATERKKIIEEGNAEFIKEAALFAPKSKKGRVPKRSSSDDDDDEDEDYNDNDYSVTSMRKEAIQQKRLGRHITYKVNAKFLKACEYYQNNQWSADAARSIYSIFEYGKSSENTHIAVNGVVSFLETSNTEIRKLGLRVLGIKGVVYNGSQDGKCTVSYYFGSVTPVAWQNTGRKNVDMVFYNPPKSEAALKKEREILISSGKTMLKKAVRSVVSEKENQIDNDKWNKLSRQFTQNVENKDSKESRVSLLVSEWLRTYSIKKAVAKCERFIKLSNSPANLILLLNELCHKGSKLKDVKPLLSQERFKVLETKEYLKRGRRQTVGDYRSRIQKVIPLVKGETIESIKKLIVPEHEDYFMLLQGLLNNTSSDVIDHIISVTMEDYLLMFGKKATEFPNSTNYSLVNRVWEKLNQLNPIIIMTLKEGEEHVWDRYGLLDFKIRFLKAVSERIVKVGNTMVKNLTDLWNKERVKSPSSEFVPYLCNYIGSMIAEYLITAKNLLGVIGPNSRRYNNLAISDFDLLATYKKARMPELKKMEADLEGFASKARNLLYTMANETENLHEKRKLLTQQSELFIIEVRDKD
jgi:16S rRNA G966 N2-methylase RsmD